MKRICKECHVERPVGLFPTAGTVKGKPYYKLRCKLCVNGLNAIAETRLCNSCGEQKPWSEFTIPSDKRSSCGGCKDVWKNRILFHSRQWKARNPSTTKRLWAAWYKQNADVSIAAAHKRRDRLSSNGGVFTAAEWRSLKKMFDFSCLCCGRREPEIKLTADHVIPVVKGGSNVISNIQPLCGHCNGPKSTKSLDFRPLYVKNESRRSADLSAVQYNTGTDEKNTCSTYLTSGLSSAT